MHKIRQRNNEKKKETTTFAISLERRHGTVAHIYIFYAHRMMNKNIASDIYATRIK